MRSTMLDVPLSLNDFLDRAGTLFKGNEIVSRLPDKSLRRHGYGRWHRRTRALASALQRLGLKQGDRVATLCWNHHAHLKACFGIPAAGGVMHTLNLRLAPDEIGWIAGADQDSFQYAVHAEDDPVAMCYTSGATGKPKGVAHSHRSTVLHTLVAALPDQAAERAPAANRLCQMAVPGALRGDRRGAAHVDRQVLEAQAARDVPRVIQSPRNQPLQEHP
ncbi:MAG: AMP-binding protein [Burkholderiales bacterium]|nr:AMP-binding protein [Burkholderiales bacterium]